LRIFLSLAKVAAQALFEIFLLTGELFGFIRHVGHLGPVLLVPHRLDRLLRLFQPLCRLLRLGLPALPCWPGCRAEDAALMSRVACSICRIAWSSCC